jgi:hypothetical protein
LTGHHTGHGIPRRAFLGGAAATLAAFALETVLPRRSWAAATLPDATLRALESSPFVYVSPLRKGGAESACHGEVWYAWLDGGVVLITARSGWKARSALEKGLDRARIWVGDHGRWKGLTGKNEGFRAAPSFDARVSQVKDPATLDRLIAAYGTKYPAEIERWRDRFREGFKSGERVLLRYEPA